MHKTVFILFFFCLVSCNKNTETVRAMYFWKVNQKIIEYDADFLLTNNIQKYYVRFFDVGWNDALGAVPKGLLNEKRKHLEQNLKFKILSDSLQGKDNLSIISVIYI